MLALKEFRLDEKSDEFLYISGKSVGFWTKILPLLGFDPVTELRCDSKNVMFKTANLVKGQVNVTIPNSSITAVATGFHKPLQLLVLGLLVSIFGFVLLIWGVEQAVNSGIDRAAGQLIFGALASGIGIAIISSYYKSKSIQFRVYTGGVIHLVAIYVGKSAVNGVKIGFELYQQAAVLLIKAVLESRSPNPKS